MDTKVPLRALLHLFDQYGHEQKMIRKELIESVFGGIMNENTPYEKVLTHHPFDSEFEVKISSEQKMCDELNEHLKDSQLHLDLPFMNKKITLARQLLTLESPMDLKPFALKIGCFLF